MKQHQWKFFWSGVVKNGCGQSGPWSLKLLLSQEWTDGINWFFTCRYNFMQIKKWLKFVAVGMVSNGCGHWFFVCWYKCRKAKCWFSSWDPKIFCILRINLWIELIFWMLHELISWSHEPKIHKIPFFINCFFQNMIALK